MIRIALLTGFALATSTVAAAQPVRVERRDDAITYQRDRDHYDRYDDSHWAHDVRGRWTPLGQEFNARHQRQAITLSGDRFRKLRLEAVRGQPLITRVVIEFGNGAAQTIDLNSSLSTGAGEVIDLAGGARRVRRVIVFTDPQARGTYAVYGA